ncbi:hypothetical protein [Rhodococcus sp. ARP2]|uniref:hypothetical protein n=1 Tax=Rhodococcus sp. ARP2 TaxID=1661385 RepID=UPI00064BDF3F|nr:hypothetical protein [Rhodococcus sp. ARP2]
MNSHSLTELRKTFSALDAHERGDYAALRQSNPLVDRIQAAMNPFVVGKPQRPLSPSARAFPVVSDGLDRARTVALDSREAEIRDRGSFLERRLEVLNRGGEPVVIVVLHSKKWTYDGEIPASIAEVVPVGYPPEEAARRIAHSAWDCWFCDREMSYNAESYLMVSCAAIVHVMSACRRCRKMLDHNGLDWADV